MKVSKDLAIEEKLLRFSDPSLYEKMIEIFSKANIHSYDIYATSIKKEDGLIINLKLSQSSSHVMTTFFTYDQAHSPDEEINEFFKEAADTCKQQLISDYFKMIKL